MNQSDFVHVPGYTSNIAKEQAFNGLKWKNAHYVLAESGLYMPPASIFTTHLVNVIEARKKDKPLYDGNGNNLIRKEVKELHRILTSDCLVWLSNSFKNDKANPGSLLMEYDHRVIDNKLIPQHIEPLDQYIMKNGVFVDLKFNAQGFPIRKSAKREYEMGKNLYFLMPVDGAVAGFVAFLDRAYFSCNRYPEDSNAALGIFACAEGAQKIEEHSLDSLIGKGTDVGKGLVVLRKEDLTDEIYSLLTKKSATK